MSYYWFNKQELLQKAKKNMTMMVKKKLLSIIKQIKDVLKEKGRDKDRNLSEEQREAKRQYSKNRYNKMKEK